MHIYEVGIGSDKRTIQAPHAGAAAIFYAVNLININNPFMAVVYTEDGQAWSGEPYWISIIPDQAHVDMVMQRITREDVKNCSVVE